jgi:hypothetical protein
MLIKGDIEHSNLLSATRTENKFRSFHTHVKHVVQKGDAGVAVTYPGAVQIDAHFNARLFCFPRDRAYTRTLCMEKHRGWP